MGGLGCKHRCRSPTPTHQAHPLWPTPKLPLSRRQPPPPAGYGDESAGLPAIDNMEQFFKDQLDNRMANGRPPMQISLYYEWCACAPPRRQHPTLPAPASLQPGTVQDSSNPSLTCPTALALHRPLHTLWARTAPTRRPQAG